MTYSRHLMTGTIFQGRETLRQVIDFLVPEVGLEPTRRVDPRGILSPVRLPIPPLRHQIFQPLLEETRKIAG
jgi:hypothetical protein